MSEANFEIEMRALLSEEEYTSLLDRLSAEATDLGADDKKVWFYVLPDKLLKVTHNVSAGNGKVTLKLNRIGQGSSFPEIEYKIDEADVPKAVAIFDQLGFEALIEPKILRHNFIFENVELAVKYSASWGYHVELEQVVNREEDRDAAEAAIKAVGDKLGLKIMTEEELAKFDGGILKAAQSKPENNPRL